MTTSLHVGKPISRVDGRAKVTGAAKYAAEHLVPGLAYGWVVSAPIARGRISRIETADALTIPGVVAVLTSENAPPFAETDEAWTDAIAPPGSPFRPLGDSRVRFGDQPVALVVADTLELARYAATQVRVEYEAEPHSTHLEQALGEAVEPRPRAGLTPAPDPRGDADGAFAQAVVKVDAEYRCPIEHHNPMEPFATTAVPEDGAGLTVYDKTQGVQNVRDWLCRIFGLSQDDVRVMTPYMGGGFGSGLRPQYQCFMAVLAARETNRPVRVTLTRRQMFSFGHRPATWQRVRLGAARDGVLEAVIHEAVAETSRFEDYSETVVDWSGMLYRCPNVRLDHKLVKLDLCTPIDMRAPGAVWGMYALESAMDELACRLEIDPVELRLRNYADYDQNEDRPFSSKALRECYRQGAERFGWARRDPRPASMRIGHTLIGMGMAGGVWETLHFPAKARAVLTADGRLTVESATADIGTGTYTIMTQLAADELGLPFDAVTFRLGDSRLPDAPVEGGSFTAVSVGSAVKAACEQMRRNLFHRARRMPGSPLAGVPFSDVTFSDGRIRAIIDPERSVSFADAVRSDDSGPIEAAGSAGPDEGKKHSSFVHSAVFVEVGVDEDLGTVRVRRVVSAVAGGRILNPKTARSQILGAVVGGIGSALQEESVIDQALGRLVTRNLADYHVPVNADVPGVDVIFVDERDDLVNPLGAKGLGEIGIVGVAAAVANAVHHATGRRIRELPITLDKVHV